MRFLRLVALGAALLILGFGSAWQTWRLRGELVWNSERHTLTPCGTELTYWVRVLASNSNSWLSQRVDELSRDEPAGVRIIADLEGRLVAVPSVGPTYPVDQALYVFRIHSVELGACE